MTVPPVAAFQRGSAAPKNFNDRFWQKVQKSNTCWFWIGYRNRNGYGGIRVPDEPSMQLAHRVSWVLANGQILDDLCVLHKCDCPACVRPSHLFLGTRPENSADMRQKGRFPLGEKHGNSRLTEEDVLEIRNLRVTTRLSYQKIADRFGVSETAIRKICNRVVWTHV